MSTPLSGLVPTRSATFDPLQTSLQRRRSFSNKQGTLAQKSFFAHPEVFGVRVADPKNSLGSVVGAFRRSGEFSLQELPDRELREIRKARESCGVEEGEREFEELGSLRLKMARSISDPVVGEEKIEMVTSLTSDDPLFKFQVRGKNLYQHVKF
eukprot:CAMPEP_0174900224 /NCGR_PEP_ID=MMETSP0167-20121228/30294_1 /TAXON_ID=38298 /ORGANISM="Rhodella maculata, Strain CCMP736" /LENGTH=153 /DNA_ID=CAMNT_0016141501 /DNA_START=494 /DNA_END=955 /DNA_ORIENTATION=-